MDWHQLTQLQQGSKVWNEWREQHPHVLVNLGGANLIGADLTRSNLTRAILTGTRFTRAKLGGANLSNTDLSYAYLMEAELTNANLCYANLNSANFYFAILCGAHLGQANLGGADLRKANLTKANLEYAILDRADLSGADLSSADLSGANLSYANLSETDMSYANLKGANLSHAVVGWTVLGDIDFRSVKGLETVRHIGPSTIGTDTLTRSQGQIPEQFLRHAGVSELFISYTRSLAQNPDAHCTYLISYCSEDKYFAQKLSWDLQQRGFRCWLAPENMKMGKSRRYLEDYIELYDYLILIFSSRSIRKQWLEIEVEVALARERRKQCAVLYALDLEQSIKRSSAAWSAAISKSAYMIDFSKWQQHKFYQKALQRLLGKLQANM